MARKYAAKGFICLLAVMVIFTVLSRITASFTVALVITEQPAGKKIEHIVTASGSVDKNLELAVLTEPGILVKTVYAAEGRKVEEGDLLAELDLKDLEEKIKDMQNEIQILRLSNDAIDKTKKAAQQDQTTALQRAQEDYNQAVSDQEAAVAKAADGLQRAQDVYDIYKRACDEGSGSGVENLTIEERIAQLRILEDGVKAQQSAYDAALISQRDALKNAQRSMEDAQASHSEDHMEEINKINISEKEKDLEKLQEIKAAGGKVTAPVKGVVTKIDIAAGQKTSETAAVTLADLSSGMRYTAHIEKADTKYVSLEDEVTLSQNEHKLTGLVIDTMETNEDGSYDVTVILSDDTFSIGDAPSIELRKQSEAYPICVPASALHQVNGTYFVYVLTTEETVLGEQYYAQKVEVAIQDMNGTYAALKEGTLTQESRVITDSDRYIGAGSRVRLQES